MHDRIHFSRGVLTQNSDTGTDDAVAADSAIVARFFDEMSAGRNERFRQDPVLDYEQQARSRAVLAFVNARAGDTILDIGCGNARDIVALLRAGARVVGVDLSEGMIAQARVDLAKAGFEGVTLEVGDATQLGFPADTFDKVIFSEVIEHIPDAARAVDEIHRVLKPGGTVVVSTPNRASWYGFDRYVLWERLLRRKWNHPFDNWRTIQELQSLLESRGFTVTRKETTCYIPGFLLTYFLPRVLQRLVVRIVSAAEPLASRGAPGSGYLLLATAVKR
jgi:ubiquinone/menaquinone biosynthesis C-methylase UbiE